MSSTTGIAVAAIVVSIIVALVQYAQWRTANQKVVVDLYERRLRVYGQLEAAIAEVLREGNVSHKAFSLFAVGQSDARFLFGKEVQDYLQSLRNCFAWMSSFTDAVIDQSPERQALIEKKYEHLKRIVDFYNEAPDLFEPYMRLTQKNTPFWRPW